VRLVLLEKLVLPEESEKLVRLVLLVLLVLLEQLDLLVRLEQLVRLVRRGVQGLLDQHVEPG
jgi:hypothetical protein